MNFSKSFLAERVVAVNNLDPFEHFDHIEDDIFEVVEVNDV